MSSKENKSLMKRIEWSAVITALGIILLFSTAVIVTLIAPSLIDPSWSQASSSYQVQMYQNSDPNVYIAKADPQGNTVQYVYHLKNNETYLAFTETQTSRIVAPTNLEKHITKYNDSQIKLTRQLLLLRKPQKTASFDAEAQAENMRQELQKKWRKDHLENVVPFFEILELYQPEKSESFAIAETDGIVENWIDKNFVLNDSPQDVEGHIYINNPKEYRIAQANYQGQNYWIYNPNGTPIENLEELKSPKLGFLSRKELINIGEDIYKIEGCWYCHTDQTRTLIQDTVINGSASFPAPPSSANEYIYQNVTFPGTRRIGPDISRVGIKKPSRDWHKSHFWSPTIESPGTIMPSFRHFFDYDSFRGSENPYGVPNYKFEAIFQYLMTKGTRITPPNQAWWLGKDPIDIIKIIEGRPLSNKENVK